MINWRWSACFATEGNLRHEQNTVSYDAGDSWHKSGKCPYINPAYVTN